MQQFVLEFCETEDDVAAGGADQVVRVVEKPQRLGQQRECGIALGKAETTLLKNRLRF